MTKNGVAWRGYINGATYTDSWSKSTIASSNSLLLAASRISEIHPVRYFCTVTMWSYRQRAIVVHSEGYLVFFDYGKIKITNLLEYGGVYADLHKDLVERIRVGEIEKL
ncbi:hypothetical protein DFH09DRAFT_1106293 [Mycena vulgaris]|nr:hypothetical protein DFH09DRAFT_1106293 [Mycena vulgaris]